MLARNSSRTQRAIARTHYDARGARDAITVIGEAAGYAPRSGNCTPTATFRCIPGSMSFSSNGFALTRHNQTTAP
jgi:hypothetical protein